MYNTKIWLAPYSYAIAGDAALNGGNVLKGAAMGAVNGAIGAGIGYGVGGIASKMGFDTLGGLIRAGSYAANTYQAIKEHNYISAGYYGVNGFGTLNSTIKDWHYQVHGPSESIDLTKIGQKPTGYRELAGREKIFHTYGEGNEGNRKFLSSNGKEEWVFNAEGALVTDPTNSGSRNLFGPGTFLDNAGHVLMDVSFYFPYGNAPGDRTTVFQRVSRVNEYFK